MMNESSCSVMPVNYKQQMSQTPQALSDIFSQYDIYALAAEEMDSAANKLKESCRQYKKQNSFNIPKSQHFSMSVSKEYSEMLNKKDEFVEKLSDVLERSDPIGVPKYKLHCYQEFYSVLNNRSDGTIQIVHQQREETEKLKNESNLMNSQISAFSELLEEQIDDEGQHCEPRRVWFREAKKDLQTIINTLYPNEETRGTFISSFAPLIAEFVNNLGMKENQYIELTTEQVNNKVFRCLLQGDVIIQHPKIHTMFRLCFEE